MFEYLRRVTGVRPFQAATAPSQVDAPAKRPAAAPPAAVAQSPLAEAPAGVAEPHRAPGGKLRLRVPRIFVVNDVPMPLTYH